jgi:hypothetical protein
MSYHGNHPLRVNIPARPKPCRTVLAATVAASGIDAQTLMHKSRRREWMIWRAASWIVMRKCYPSLMRVRAARFFDMHHTSLIHYERKWAAQHDAMLPYVNAIIGKLGEQNNAH